MFKIKEAMNRAGVVLRCLGRGGSQWVIKRRR
jgi:hypothetical protein